MTDKILKAIMEIAYQMIEVGAEIHRVEDSVTRICHSYGVKRTDVYATTSNIIVSVEDTDGSVLTQTRKIKHIGTDIERLDRLNDLVRGITRDAPEVSVIHERLEQIDKTKSYPLWITIPIHAMIAGAFCMFFGGRRAGEILAAVLIGLFVGFLAKTVETLKINKLLSRFLCSLLACLSAYLCLKLGFIHTVSNVIIGNIMLLIPGVGLTNALRDLFAGDIITGILRFIEALLLALMVAMGYVLAAFMLGGAL